MKIIRMQDKDGIGPYAKSFFTEGGEYLTYDEKWATSSHCDDAHPGIYDDLILGNIHNDIPRGIRFGFATIKKAKAWFNPDEIRTLKGLGFNLVVLEVAKVWHGDKQSVFVPLDNS